MNIEQFFKSLDKLDNFTIATQNYPKNVNYLVKHKTFNIIKNRNISYNKINNTYMLYTKKNDNMLYSIGIDSELNYIKNLDYTLKFPKKNRIYLSEAILEGIELFDALVHIENNPYIKSNMKINLEIIRILLSSNPNQLDIFDQELLLGPFDNNPIKKDVFIAQFKYFIKKYLEFRLHNESDKETRVDRAVFEIKLNNCLETYLSNIHETVFHQVIIKEIINDISSK